MRVAVLGAGGIGLGYAAQLLTTGHEAVVWSPSGNGLVDLTEHGLTARGAVAAELHPDVEHILPEAVHGADVVLVAMPAPGRRALFEALAPLLASSQTVIVSAELSLGSYYLRERVTTKGVGIVAWSTTALTGRRLGPAQVEVGPLRQAVPTAIISDTDVDTALTTCRELFGDLFRPVPALAMLLGNLNPQVHMANVICNLTRIDKAECWANYDGITPAVARLIEDLDEERLALASACGVAVHSVSRHFQLSFGLPADKPLAWMAAELHRLRGGPPGPTSLSTRFITEDVPFGIVPLLRLAECKDIPLVLHQAGLRLIDSLCGLKHEELNDLLDQDVLVNIARAEPGSV